MLLAFLRNYDRGRVNAVVALPRGSALCGALAGLGTDFIETDGLAEQSLSFAGIKNLARIIRKTRPDIVHTHASMSARIAARLFPGVKIVYTRHSVFPNKPALTVFPGNWVAGAVNNLLATRIIAVSPAARDNITETGVNPRKVEVIYNGTDALPPLSADEKRAVRAEYGLGAEDFVCGIFARLTPVKGHEYILEAARVLSGDPSVKIIIAGAGELEETIKKRIVSENLENVLFTGFIKEPARLMAALDVQLNASYGTEATSLTLLESMSAGIPAVASSYGGNPYVIQNGVNGFVTPQRDSAAIAEAVRKLRDPALYSIMSQNAKKIYAERFTAEIMTRGIENLYFSLIDKSW